MTLMPSWTALGTTAVLLLMLMLLPAGGETSPRLLHDGPLARDVLKKIEWMRCSLGQVWEENTCVGSAKLLTHDQLDEALSLINARAGNNWRLPTRDELESLVIEKDLPPTIDAETFPETDARGYWTSEANFLSPRFFWSVNFLTGHTYGRTSPSVPNAVRLVRDTERAGLSAETYPAQN